MAAVRVLVGSALTIAAFTFLLEVTFLMGTLFMFFLKSLSLLGFRFQI